MEEVKMEQINMKYIDLYSKLNYCNCSECVKYINFKIEKDNQIDIALNKMKTYKIRYLKMRLLEESVKIIDMQSLNYGENSKKKLKMETQFQYDLFDEYSFIPINIMGFQFTKEIFDSLLYNTKGSVRKLENNIEEYVKRINLDMQNTIEDRQLYEHKMNDSKIPYSILGEVNIIIYKLKFIKDLELYTSLYNSYVEKYKDTENVNAAASVYVDTVMENSKKGNIIVIHFGFPYNINVVSSAEKYDIFKLNVCLNQSKSGMLSYILNDTNTEKGVICLPKVEDIINNVINKTYANSSGLVTFVKKIMAAPPPKHNKFISGKEITKINESILKIRKNIPEDN